MHQSFELGPQESCRFFPLTLTLSSFSTVLLGPQSTSVVQIESVVVAVICASVRFDATAFIPLTVVELVLGGWAVDICVVPLGFPFFLLLAREVFVARAQFESVDESSGEKTNECGAHFLGTERTNVGEEFTMLL